MFRVHSPVRALLLAAATACAFNAGPAASDASALFPASPGRGRLDLDDPQARQEWLRRQRAYPFAHIPVRAYADAAREYLRRREEVRRRHLQMQDSQTPGARSW